MGPEKLDNAVKACRDLLPHSHLIQYRPGFSGYYSLAKQVLQTASPTFMPSLLHFEVKTFAGGKGKVKK